MRLEKDADPGRIQMGLAAAQRLRVAARRRDCGAKDHPVAAPPHRVQLFCA
jgi:hypothetical protein